MSLENINKKSSYMYSIIVQYDIPAQFYQVYEQLNNDSHCLRICDFTLYSPDDIKKNQIYYSKFDVIPPFIDLGQIYHGMGYYVVLSYDPRVKSFYYRLDGGGNDYDRCAREEFYFGIETDNHTYKKSVAEPKFNPHAVEKKLLINPDNILSALNIKNLDDLNFIVN